MQELKLDFMKLEDKLAEELSDVQSANNSVEHPEQKSGKLDILFGACR